MRALSRLFARAIVRRIAYAVAVILLAAMGVGRAHAQACTTSGQCDQGQAFVAAVALADANGQRICKLIGGNNSVYQGHAVKLTSQGTYTAFVSCSPGGSGSNAGQTYFSKGCSSRSPENGAGPWSSEGKARNGSLGCQAGCDGVWYGNADGSMTFNVTGDLCPNDEKSNCEHMPGGYYWNALLRVCEPPEGKCPNGAKPNSLGQCAPEPCPDGMAQQPDGTCKKKDEECPAGQIRSPLGSCIPGDNQCATGEVRGKDGTCKRDRDGDGKPDEGEEEGEGPDGEKVKENFSGGDDCTAPPSCSGSPIMCGQARIQWRIDCNTRRNRNIAGGTCNAMPICTGEKCDAMEYSQLLMQWRSACAVEKLLAKGNGSSTTSPTDANGNGVADVLEGQGDVTSPGNGSADVASAKKWGIGVSSSMLDTSDMFGGGSCPQPPAIVIMGKSISGSDIPYFCQLAAIMRALILVFGAYLALRILMGGGF